MAKRTRTGDSSTNVGRRRAISDSTEGQLGYLTKRLKKANTRAQAQAALVAGLATVSSRLASVSQDQPDGVSVMEIKPIELPGRAMNLVQQQPVGTSALFHRLGEDRYLMTWGLPGAGLAKKGVNKGLAAVLDEVTGFFDAVETAARRLKAKELQIGGTIAIPPSATVTIVWDLAGTKDRPN